MALKNKKNIHLSLPIEMVEWLDVESQRQNMPKARLLENIIKDRQSIEKYRRETGDYSPIFSVEFRDGKIQNIKKEC